MDTNKLSFLNKILKNENKISSEIINEKFQIELQYYINKEELISITITNLPGYVKNYLSVNITQSDFTHFIYKKYNTNLYRGLRYYTKKINIEISTLRLNIPNTNICRFYNSNPYYTKDNIFPDYLSFLFNLIKMDYIYSPESESYRKFWIIFLVNIDYFKN